MATSNIICVIEDNMPIRKLFCTLLKKSGYETMDFGDGRSALDWLEGNDVKAILMDILLPDINGTDLIKLVRNFGNHATTPVVAATGFAASQDREKFLELGFTGYLAKPINTSTFVNELENFINNN